MNLSNRSYQDALSRQLAEFGVEEGLRALNNGDWSDWSSTPAGVAAGSWSLDSSSKRATRTITFSADKIGQGNTATVKIRVDNYDANVLGTVTWNSSRTYGINELVEYNGEWFRSTRNSNVGNIPSATGNMGNWAPEPFPWAWRSNKNYQQNIDVVCKDGTWYRCTSTHTSTTTFDSTKWNKVIAAPQLAMVPGTSYTSDQYVYSASHQTWYRCLTPHTFSSFVSANWEAVSGSSSSTYYPPWAYRTSVNYSFNDVVYHDGTWYRYTSATPSSIVPTHPLFWDNALAGGMFVWSSSGTKYHLGDVFYASSRWYRCIKSHASSGSLTPATSTSYWATTPSYSTAWDATRSYLAGDLVRHNGFWYRCARTITGGSGASITDSYYWYQPGEPFFAWNRGTFYGTGSGMRYGGAWYTCVLANTGASPNDTNYWTATRGNSAGVSTGATVIYAEATVSIAGNRPIQIQLRALVHPASLFPNALGATGAISLGSG